MLPIGVHGYARICPNIVRYGNDRFQYFPHLQRKILYVWVGSEFAVKAGKTALQGGTAGAGQLQPFPHHEGKVKMQH